MRLPALVTAATVATAALHTATAALHTDELSVHVLSDLAHVELVFRTTATASGPCAYPSSWRSVCHLDAVPAALGDAVQRHGVRELRLTTTSGAWDTRRWGPRPGGGAVPVGTALAADFYDAAATGADWDALRQAVGALAGGLPIREAVLDEPWLPGDAPVGLAQPSGSGAPTLRPGGPNARAALLGGAAEPLVPARDDSADGNACAAAAPAADLWYGAWPRQTPCVEDVAAWLRLTPCGGGAGLESLLDGNGVVGAAQFGLEFRAGLADGALHVALEASVVLPLDDAAFALSALSAAPPPPLCGAGPARVVTTLPPGASATFSAAPDATDTDPATGRARHVHSLATDAALAAALGGDAWFTLDGGDAAAAAAAAPPSVVATRHGSKAGPHGLFGGTVSVALENRDPLRTARVSVVDAIPDVLSPLLHTLAVEGAAAPGPANLRLTPSVRAERPAGHLRVADGSTATLLEYDIDVPPNATAVVTVAYLTRTVPMMSWPPDAARGWQLPSVVASVVALGGEGGAVARVASNSLFVAVPYVASARASTRTAKLTLLARSGTATGPCPSTSSASTAPPSPSSSGASSTPSCASPTSSPARASSSRPRPRASGCCSSWPWW